jgi:hypothetical protein
VAHVADLAAGAHVADSAAVVVTWAVAAATAVADTGKFLIFPQNPRSCGIPPEKARLLRQAGLFCRFEDEQILVEIRGFPPFRQKEG